MAKKRIAARRPNSIYRARGRFGIKNHVGGLWTPETFQSAPDAQKYLDDARKTWPDGGVGLRRHKVVPVNVTISLAKS